MMGEESTSVQDRFASIVNELRDVPGVAFGSPGKKGFGRDALTIDGKIFAMCVKDRLVLKLTRQRVDELTASRQGERFDPGHGRQMKEWIGLSPTSSADWLALAKESLEFVRPKSRL